MSDIYILKNQNSYLSFPTTVTEDHLEDRFKTWWSKDTQNHAVQEIFDPAIPQFTINCTNIFVTAFDSVTVPLTTHSLYMGGAAICLRHLLHDKTFLPYLHRNKFKALGPVNVNKTKNTNSA